MKKATIIGTGAYGTVLANVLSDNGVDVTMYGIDQYQIKDINVNHQNSAFFGDVRINSNILATNDINQAFSECQIIIICVPTVAFNSVLTLIEENLKQPVYLINTSKGLDLDNLDFLSNKLKSKFKNNSNIKSISGIYGPSLARECIEKKPTCVMVANENIEDAKLIAKLFTNDYFFAKSTSDIIGCEIAAALKNTIAIACGIFDGYGLGDNAHASLITIGNMEIYKFASHFGAKLETFLNFATVGDLVLTASSTKSRNFSLGRSIAYENDAEKVLKTHNVTVEGVITCKTTVNIAKKYNIIMPLFELMYEILYNKDKPSKLVKSIFKNSMA